MKVSSISRSQSKKPPNSGKLKQGNSGKHHPKQDTQIVEVSGHYSKRGAAMTALISRLERRPKDETDSCDERRASALGRRYFQA